MSEAPNAIDIHDLRIDYGDKVAVDGLTLSVGAGEIFGLLGPNGAGKSSTFRVLATLQEPTYGDVLISGIDLAESPEKVRHQLGYMPDLAPVPTDLKVWEFLDLFAASHGMPSLVRKDRIAECLAAVNMEDSRNVYCKALSRGMTQRVVLARNLLHRPKVLILDEPASGMDPYSRAALWKTLQELAGHGATIVISSHILRELSDLCTFVGILHQGRLLDSGPAQEVANRLAGRSTVLKVRIIEKLENAQKVLDKDSLVGDVKHDEGILEIPFSGGEEDQAHLLTKLISAGCAVTSFYPQLATMEEVLLNLSADSQQPPIENKHGI